MAVKPYQEGAVWSFRLRIKGQDVYRTGYSSEAEARRQSESLRQKILDAGKPKHDGPWRNTLAEALQRYAMERLSYLKGARQEANRINRYLRAVGMATVRIGKASDDAAAVGKYHEVTLDPPRVTRSIPNGLHFHREQQRERSSETERLVRQLAKTSVAEITAYKIQELVDTMVCDGYQAASVALERALLRQLFNHARKSWLWVEPRSNPATHLSLPKIDNARDRVLTNAEWDKISLELERLSAALVN